jgi:A/G-specific adenine glycosylase
VAFFLRNFSGIARRKPLTALAFVLRVRNLKNVELQEFRKALLGWFREFQRDLPWRKNRDPYRIWISEIMLQQTRVAAVVPYYERFLSRFPDVQSLASTPQEEVLRLWSGLGYYSRARNLQKAAQQIVAEHAGQFPREREELLALAGIGEYTASAILSIAFGDKHAVLDGNVARVVARLEAMRGDLRESKRWRDLQCKADQLLEHDSAGDWNQAMMELGATICLPRSPQCLLCPVANFCQARKLGLAENIPQKRKKRATVSIQLVSVVLLDATNRSLLLPAPTTATKNNADDHIPSLVAKLWHFPTVSVLANCEDALERLLHHELRIKPAKSIRPELLDKIRHTVTYRTISIAAYLIRVKQLPKISGAQSLSLDNIPFLPISNLTHKIAKAAFKHLSATRNTR